MLQWACASIGAILVTLNPAYRIHEFVRPLPTHLITLMAFFTDRYLKISRCKAPFRRPTYPLFSLRSNVRT